MAASNTIQSFFSNYPVHLYKKGEVLIQTGDTPAAHFILSGLIIQYDIAKNGSKLIVNTYKPGSFISLASILNDIPSAFYFEATESTRTQVAPRAAVVEFLKDNPATVYDTLVRITRGGDGLMLRLARAMEGGAEDRILQELVIIQNRFMNSETTITITDTELATRTGLARETVSRTLKKLDAEGIIHSSRGKITLSDTLHT